MLDAVIRFSLTHRLLVVVVSLTLLLYGGYLTTRLPIDVLPDLDRPRVVILTESPGLAAEEVETLISQPLETAVLGASGVQDVRSQSVAGLNVLYVEFDWSVEVRAARQTVQERLATSANTLPPGVSPYMAPTASIMGQIVIAGIHRPEGPARRGLAPLGDHAIPSSSADRTGPDGQPWLTVWRPTIGNDLASGNGWTWTPSSRTGGPTRPRTGGRSGRRPSPRRPFPCRDEQPPGPAYHRRLGRPPAVAQDPRRGRGVRPWAATASSIRCWSIRPLCWSTALRCSRSRQPDAGQQPQRHRRVRSKKVDTERPIRVLGRLGPDSGEGDRRAPQGPGQVNDDQPAHPAGTGGPIEEGSQLQAGRRQRQRPSRRGDDRRQAAARRYARADRRGHRRAAGNRGVAAGRHGRQPRTCSS